VIVATLLRPVALPGLYGDERTFCDSARCLSDACDHCPRAARVYLDHLGAYRYRNAVPGQPSERTIEWRGEDR
jgi:hypothetical protein